MGVAFFEFHNSDSTFYGSHNAIEMMNFYLSEAQMHNQTSNPANKKYNTVYDGTFNVNSVLQAQSISTKGHFYQTGDALKDKIPDIYDHNATLILPNEDDDETWLGIEKFSGVVM
jgi:hypothetical protein